MNLLKGRLLLSKLIFLVIFIFIYNISFADEYFWKNNGSLRQDASAKDRINIYDKEGEYKGYLKKDRISDDRRVYIFNENGKEKGYITQDPVFRDRVIIRNKK